MNPQKTDRKDRLTLRELSGSVVAAAIGVQSSANRKRDFTRGRPHQFVVAGVLATTVFVLSLLGVVRLVAT